MRLDGPLDRAALKRALDALVARHEMLRTRLVADDGEAVQEIDPAEVGFALQVCDLAGQPDAGPMLTQLQRDEATAPFDLAGGPLARGRLVVLGQDRHVLLLTLHHIVADGWSIGVLLRELGALYAAFASGRDNPLPPLPMQYAEYASTQRAELAGGALAKHVAYWKRALAGAPQLLELPADRSRPAEQDYRGGHVRLELDAELSAALKALSLRYGSTLFMTLLAAWALVLSRLSGQTDVVIGTPTANRRRAELEGLVGLFANTLALRIDLSGAPTAGELLRRVRDVALDGLEHQDLPFEQVVELVNPARSLAHAPLFQAMFAWQHGDDGELALPGIDVTSLPSPYPVAKLDLTLALRERNGRIVGSLEYAGALFDAATVERYGRYLRRLLEGMVARPAAPVATLPLLDEPERRQLLAEWNGSPVEPTRQLIHEMFEAQVARDPHAVAVVSGGRSLRYGELNERANRLAHHLRERGVGPDRLVAICSQRSPEAVVALLAVLKAGGAYLPLDPAYPAQRLAYMLRDSRPALLITSGLIASGGAAVTTDVPLPVVDLDADGAWADQPAENPDPRAVGLTPGHLAYAIYTSGSTGEPKGVLVEHGQLTAVAAGWRHGLGLEPGLVHLQLASFSFDVFTADVVRAIGFGGRLVICPPDVLLDSAGLYAALRRHGVGFVDIVPAVLNPLLDHVESVGGDLGGLRTVVCGSDAWTPATASRLRALCGPTARIVNAYGVTEAAVDSTHYALPTGGLDELTCLPIGRPLPGVRIYLLDEAGEPVPAGVVGEIHVGGAGVARGYLDRPALTAERFVANPFMPGDRIYKTGDLGRWLPGWQLEFIGRNDSQIKIRGFRVEPGEVQARLAACPGVRDAVVVAGEDAGGGKRLVAYYLATDGGAGAPGGAAAEDGAGADPAAVRDLLATQLPAHLVPAACVRLAAWPLTPNGKLDRAALPAPSAPGHSGNGHVGPIGPVETALARLWADVLGVERVDRHGDFFALGGHSLLAMRLVSKIRQELGREVPPTALFAAPTPAALADRLATAGRRTLPPIRRADRSAPLPLSFAQQRLWFLAQLEGASEAYHMPLALRLDGPLDRGALRSALDAIVARHEVLRTRLVTARGEAFQHVDPPGAGFALRIDDLAGAQDARARIAAAQREEVAAPFDLARGPLARGRLLVLAPDRHVLLLTLHHIVSDGWSTKVLLRELGELYAGFRRGETEPLAALPPLPLHYADYAVWQREWLSDRVLAEQGAYWRQVLSGAPEVLELPADRPRPAEQDYRGGQVRLELDAQLSAGLKALSERCGTTLFMTLLAAWALVLSRLSGQNDVVIGTPTANRRRAELEGVVGFFVNTLALRIDLSGAPTVRELLRRVRQVTLAGLEHQDLPFEQVVELVNPARSLAHAPLFQAMFAWQHDEDGELVLPDIDVTALPAPWTVAKFDLALSLGERHGRIVGGLEYAGALFDAATVQRYGRYLHRVLAQLVARPEAPVAELSLPDARERRRLLVEWNDTEVGPPRRTVSQLFEEQVARDPAAVAVEFGRQRMSYGELNERANRLAHHLRALGVGPDRLVAICLQRCQQAVVALLAVLKAGGAYVPLDPAYPADRLSFMLRDSNPTLLITDSALGPTVPATGVPVLDVDADGEWAAAPATGLPPVRRPDHLAYVIYTSGSTGRPKGVAQTWRSMDNLIWWQLHHAAPDSPAPSKVLQFASISFDVSFQEIWSTLCQGATLVLMSEDRRAELAELPRFLTERSVQRAFLPAAVLQQLSGLLDPALPRPRPGCEIVTAGEALRVDDGLRSLVAWLGGGHLYNHYGPTEAHAVSQHTLACADAASWPALPPIGRPIANTRLYVLDASLEPVPVGVAGELYIGGAGLARGYLGRPALTAERFLPDPFGEPGARMYRSGDLARWLADGTLDYLGRTDNQVKVRGFRVELGEIESVLGQLPGVRQAAVLHREDTPGDRHLVAYLAGDVGVDAVREQLRRRLPEHLVPTRWVVLDRLPLTVNGKLDRRALPAPDRDAGAAAYRAPRDEREARLAAIWADVLGCERVGVDDDFFALGGHSLLATRLVHAVNQRMSARLSLRSLFRNPVLADLAAQLAVEPGRAEAGDVLPQLEPDPAGRHRPFPLTDIQQAYWVGRQSSVELGGVGAHAYREISVPEFAEDRFTRALNRLIARHDMLRAVFRSDGTQQVLPTVPPYRMPRHDLRGLDPATAQRRLAEIRERMSHQLLDAGHWPLFEFALTLLDGAEVRLHISMDALIVDAASGQILERELMRLYADPDAVLPPLALAFRDYVLAEQELRRAPRYERALDYWRRRAAELPPAPELPLVRQPDTVQRPRFTRYDAMLPAERWTRLKELAKRHGVTPSVLLLTAFAQVLALWSRRPRFTLSLPLFNRLPLHAGIDSVIGDFTSLVLLEVDVAAAVGFAAQARAVQERLWQDMDNSAVSGVRVIRELAKARGTGQPAMPVVFNSTLSELAPGLGDGGGSSLATALGGESVHAITQTPQVWIDHTVLEYEGRLHFNWDSIDELFGEGMVAEMFATYRELLARLEEPAAWQDTVDALLATSASWHRVPPPQPPPARPRPPLHELFDRQALATPDAVAVLSPERRLSYRTLRREARQLAGRLQASGVRPGDLVAVLLDRGWEQVVGTLAVLYAGGAYVPVDPALPAERVAHLLERTGARLALLQPAQLAGTPASALPDGVERVVVDAAACGDGGPALRPVASADTDIAYVVYTSGSTGTPKGVVIDHRGAVNTLLDVDERFAVGPADRVLALSSLSFDLSVFDIFGTLAAGAAIVTLDPEHARDPAHWHELLRTHRVSVWNSVPALLGMLVEYAESHPEPALPPSLRLVMLSGDWIPLALPDRLRRLRPDARVHSLGGATEASIWSIHHPIGEIDPAWRSIPYGTPMRNQRFHVLDEAMRPRPTWVPGELYIGGLGVAKGYWRDDARTAASFVTHPGTGERLYRTGDLGRWLPDGTIEFLGREDGQVKVHGYRVELGEIEAALERHPAVRAAAARVFGDAHGDKRLAGYVVAGDADLDPDALQRHLRRTLPPYMVPGSITVLDALPLSANGKVDRSRLPEPAAADPAERPPAAQEPLAQAIDGPAEARLVGIVEEVLGRKDIGLRANLLQLGATSIDIVRIGNALSSELGFRPRLAQLMLQPTVADLLAMYREHASRRAIVAAHHRAVSSAPSNAPQSAAPGAPSGAVVDDPRQRKEFVASGHGRRSVDETATAIALPAPADPAFARRYGDYRSVRQFGTEPVAAAAMAELLACLSRGELDGRPKYLYGSAGGCYPVQAYLYVKPGRVAGVAGGAYYYDPHRHRLVAVGDGRALDPEAYDYFVNRPVFEAAAFALFLVAELAAIEPLYGEQSIGFCQIEAGAMAQLLTMSAAAHGLGVCGIGSVAAAEIEPLFELGPTHRLIYSMVGGPRQPAAPAQVDPAQMDLAQMDLAEMDAVEI